MCYTTGWARNDGQHAATYIARYSHTMTIFPFSDMTLLVGRQEGHPACKKKIGSWFVVGDDLTGALHDLQLQLSPLTTSIKLSFNKHRLTQVHLENGR